jgi:hypothetical protein
MKRRAKASDEWVDLVQAETDRDDNRKDRGSKFNRKNVAVFVGLAFVILIKLNSVLNQQRDKAPWRQHLGLAGGSKRRSRKVVLLGPHDRYSDFGDILAERVMTKLLVEGVGFVYNATDDRDNTILLGGIVTRDDMDRHGLTPGKTVHSMKDLQALSRKDAENGPYDIVFTGGSGEGPGDEGPAILYERHRDAMAVLETGALRDSALSDRVYDCPYLFPKELLLPVVNKTLGTNTRKHLRGSVTTLPRPRKNYAIVDSLETPQQPQGAPLECRRVVIKADHLGYRASKPFAPDCTVATREVLGSEIDTVFDREVIPDLREFPEFIAEDGPLKYVAVQHEKLEHQLSDASYAQKLADALDEVSQNLGNIPVVFFPAGRVGRSVGDHIAFGLSREVASKMKQPCVLYETENALRVAALISGAEAVLSTNLHVRILAFVYQKPRATWHGGVNHQSFLDLWEAGDVGRMGTVDTVKDTWTQGLQGFFETTTSSNRVALVPSLTEAANKKAVKHYLQNFETWSDLLITPTGRGDDDDDAVV